MLTLTYAANKSSTVPCPVVTCSNVQLCAFLSGRHLKNFVPCRNRPPEKWSYCTSHTSFGSSLSHSPLRSVLHRLGPPGAFPVKPSPPIYGFSTFFNSARRSALKLDEKPTWSN